MSGTGEDCPRIAPAVRVTDGWLSAARRIASPNCDARPDGERISLLVIHAISLPPGKFGGDEVERLFLNTLDPAADPYFETLRGLRVSAHFFIRRDGTLVQFVSCLERAWHAGLSSFRGRSRCNDFSIGIELEGCDECVFEAAQYRRLRELVPVLRRYFPIEAIVGHADIAPGRKTDPGPFFEWQQLSGMLLSDCNK